MIEYEMMSQVDLNTRYIIPHIHNLYIDKYKIGYI